MHKRSIQPVTLLKNLPMKDANPGSLLCTDIWAELSASCKFATIADIDPATILDKKPTDPISPEKVGIRYN
jgi:hypothetical protein